MNFSLLEIDIHKNRYLFRLVSFNSWNLLFIGHIYKFNSCRVFNTDEMHPKIFTVVICGRTIIERLIK